MDRRDPGDYGSDAEAREPTAPDIRRDPPYNRGRHRGSLSIDEVASRVDNGSRAFPGHGLRDVTHRSQRTSEIHNILDHSQHVGRGHCSNDSLLHRMVPNSLDVDEAWVVGTSIQSVGKGHNRRSKTTQTSLGA